MRVYRDTPAGEPVAEARAHPESRHQFVHVEQAGKTYVAELGYYQADRRWVAVVHSEPVLTPQDSAAEDRTVRFAAVAACAPTPESPRPFPPLSIKTDGTGPVAGLPATLKTPILPAPQWLPGFVQAARHRPMPLLEMLRATLPPHQPSPLPHVTPEWTPARERALAELLRSVEARQEGLSSLALLARDQRQGESHAGPAPVPGVAAEFPGPELPAMAFGVSSPAGGEKSAPPGFWFNVNAELVIYGATVPGSQLIIGGQCVPLRPDGTFSFRLSLPDGQHELSLAATSASGDLRRAELKFSRHTDYHSP